MNALASKSVILSGGERNVVNKPAFRLAPVRMTERRREPSQRYRFEGHRRKRRGFTLMEMMITLAVFMLLAAAVFGLMTGVLQSTATLQDGMSRADETTALKAYLKKKLSQLPARSTIFSYQRGDGEGLVQNGIIFGNTNFATCIDAQIQANGYYTLRETTYETTADPSQPQDARQVLQQAVTTSDPTLIWNNLIADIKTVDWKFLDFNNTVWVELWSSTAQPNLVELDTQIAGDLQPVAMDFWLPKIDTISLGNSLRTNAAPH